MHVLKTPLEVRNALAYVLTNESRHQLRHTRAKQLAVKIDPFSSAFAFDQWKRLTKMKRLRIDYQTTSWSEAAILAWYETILMPPKAWLLKVGWAA